MDRTERGGPGKDRPTTTYEPSVADAGRDRCDNPQATAGVTADVTPAQRWAAAWLAGPHTDDERWPTCSAGWALIGGAP